VFRIDVTKCEACGGEMQLVATALEKESIRRFLEHAGLAARPPPVRRATGLGFDESPAQPDDYNQMVHHDDPA